MQRVIRDPHGSDAGLAELDAKVALIKKHFPPTIASLFATARKGSDGALEWWTGLSGQPIRYQDLDERQQSVLLEKYQQRQHALGQLAQALRGRGEAQAATQLASLIGPPDLSRLYSCNGDPLVVRWSDPPPKVTPAPVIPARPVVPLARKRRLWPWLLGLLLLGLLFALWFWRGLWWGYVSTPKMQPYACRPAGSTELPPQFVTVLDTSGSMNLSLGASKQDEEWFFSKGQRLPKDDPQRLRVTAGPTRLDAAKQSLAGMIDALHPDIDTRLITFAGCHRQVDRGLFDAARRPQLIAGIQGLEATDGTPLAASLAKAAALVDGRERDAVVMMFVDGEDGCDDDVCAVSRQIAEAQPRLRVNLVSIGDGSVSTCIAENTGGRVYSSRDAGELAEAVKEASQELAAGTGCGE
jgi:hypothetical protein